MARLPYDDEDSPRPKRESRWGNIIAYTLMVVLAGLAVVPLLASLR